MGLVPIRENLRGFRGFCDDGGGFGVGPSSANSLILDEESGELVRASLGRIGRKGGVSDVKAAMALKSHSEAERRRRERINGHLATLRSMVPCSDKLDKAALLAEVINHVKKLKSDAAAISRGHSIPSDADEVRVEVGADGIIPGTFSVKASLSCEDRPDLLADLRQTLQSLQPKTVQVEIYTLGGRIKNVFVITREGTPNDMERHLFMTSVQQALMSVIDRASLQEFVPRSSFASKRRRISPFESSCSS